MLKINKTVESILKMQLREMFYEKFNVEKYSIENEINIEYHDIFESDSIESENILIYAFECINIFEHDDIKYLVAVVEDDRLLYLLCDDDYQAIKVFEIENKEINA